MATLIKKTPKYIDGIMSHMWIQREPAGGESRYEAVEGSLLSE